MRTAGPAFDNSLALEMLKLLGPDVKEGLAALRDKRAPDFPRRACPDRQAGQATPLSRDRMNATLNPSNPPDNCPPLEQAVVRFIRT